MIKKSDTVFAFDNSGTYLGVFFKQEDAWCALKNSIWLKEYILDKASKENIEIIEKARANYNLRIRIEALETILTGKNCFTDKTPYIHKPDKNKGNNNDRSK